MAHKQIAIRRAMVTVVILAAFAVLAGRLVWIQVWQHHEWNSLARRYHEARIPLPPCRGMILDRNGVKLAVSVSSRSAFANPRAIPDSDKPGVARVLARALSLKEAGVLDALERPKYFAWIKRQCTEAEAEAVDRLGIQGVGFRMEPLRVYPNGALAAHVVGFVGAENEALAGLEMKYDHAMAGRPGFEIVMRDGLGHTLANGAEAQQPPVDGYNLVLTLDTVIQQIAEEEIRKAVEKWEAAGAAAVVLQPRSGQILALASWPTFDPNRFQEATADQMFNRGVTMIFEPGSTMKSFIAASALDAKVADAETMFYCYNGARSFGGRVLHDVHGYGWLSLRDVIVKSSNIGIAQVGERLGRLRLHQAATRFGLGRLTGVDLPGEEPGMLAPASLWTSYTMTSVPMGQEVAVSAVGLAAAYNVFASGGCWHRPYVVAGLAGREGRRMFETFPQAAPRPAIRAQVADLMTNDFLCQVVERGTAQKAKLNGYAVAGKTGTAQIARKDARGYEPDSYISSFVGFAPLPAPKAVCLVMVERPKKAHYGGTVSAPVAATILERTLVYMGVPRQTTQVAMK